MLYFSLATQFVWGLHVFVVQISDFTLLLTEHDPFDGENKIIDLYNNKTQYVILYLRLYKFRRN